MTQRILPEQEGLTEVAEKLFLSVQLGWEEATDTSCIV